MSYHPDWTFSQATPLPEPYDAPGLQAPASATTVEFPLGFSSDRMSDYHSNNPQGHPNRTLQPSVSTSPFAGASTMAMSAEHLHMPQNPYPAYGYAPAESPFAFPTHPGAYRPHPPLKVPDYTQAGAAQLQHGQSTSPIASRKRGASELEDLSSLPGSSNNAGFPGLMHTGAPGELDVGLGASQTLPSPVIKKGRTNTPWTPAEEQRLKALREAGRSWSEIAKTFPTRTEGSVKKHWYKDMHYAEFAENEEHALLQAIKDYENNKWKVIGQKVGKPAKACEQFAKDKGWK